MNIALLLCGACGAGLYLLGDIGIPYAASVGASIIGFPLIVGGLSFYRRTLQFPVRLVTKQ